MAENDKNGVSYIRKNDRLEDFLTCKNDKDVISYTHLNLEKVGENYDMAENRARNRSLA